MNFNNVRFNNCQEIMRKRNSDLLDLIKYCVLHINKGLLWQYTIM